MSAMQKHSPSDFPRTRDHYKKIALNLKKRFRNASEQQQKTQEALLKVGAGLTGAGAVALASGYVARKAREQGKENFLEPGGFPLPVLAGLGLIGGSFAAKGRKRENLRTGLFSAGTHITSGVLYKYLYDYAEKG